MIENISIPWKIPNYNLQDIADNSATTPWLEFYGCRHFSTTGGTVAKVRLPLRGIRF
jgi:hypothetical protein